MLILEEDNIVTESGYKITEHAILYYNTGLFYQFGNYKELDKLHKKHPGLILMVFDTTRLSLENIVSAVNSAKEQSYYAMPLDMSIESSDLLEYIV